MFVSLKQGDASMRGASSYRREAVLKCESLYTASVSVHSPGSENVAPPGSLIVSAALTAASGAAGFLLKWSSKHGCHLQTHFR